MYANTPIEIINSRIIQLNFFKEVDTFIEKRKTRNP